MQGNSFYVQPLQGFNLGQSVQGGQRLGDMYRQHRAKGQIADAFAAGDHAKVREISAQYPDLAKGALDQIQWSNDEGKRLTTGWNRALYEFADKPEILERITRQTIREMEAAGVDTTQIMEDYRRMFSDPENYLTPDEIRARSGANLAILDGDVYDKVATPQARDIPNTAQEYEYWQSLPEGPNKDAYGRSRGFVEDAPGGPGGTGVPVEPEAPQLPPTLLEGYGEYGPQANEAYGAAGGGEKGLDAAREAAEAAAESERRAGFPEELSRRFPNVTPEERRQILQAFNDAPTAEAGYQKAEEVRQKQRDDQKGIDLIDRGATLAENILNNPQLDDVIGPREGREGTEQETGWQNWFGLSDEEANAIADIEELASILTKDNLKLMSGVLSESDIKLLRQIASGGLNRLRGEKRFREDLQSIFDKLSAARVDLGGAPLEGATNSGGGSTGSFGGVSDEDLLGSF